jgi:ribosomal protein S18 acetylase RimI-like enzyme
VPLDLSRIRIRPATREDIPALVVISNTSLAEDQDVGFGTTRSESIFSDSRWLSAVWEEPNRVRGEEVFVGVVDDQIVGLVTIEDRGPDLELINIDVYLEVQGRGIGTAIVRAVEALARKQGKVAVTLGTSRNADGVACKSLPWWQHLGYRITHEEENEWTRKIGPGAREIRMRKDLL